MFKKISLLLILCVFSIKTFAGISCASSNNGIFFEYLGFGDITIPSDAKVGDVLASTVSTYTGSAYCVWNGGGGGSERVTFWWSITNRNPIFDNVYEVDSTSGLGIRATRISDGVVIPISQTFVVDFYNRGIVQVTPIRFDLIKTGEISKDKIYIYTSTWGFSFGYTIGNTYTPFNKWYFNYAKTNVVASTCNVSNTSINVPMGDLFDSDIPAVGSAGSIIPFSIPLTCSASAQVSLNISPGAAGAFDSNNGILNLSEDALSATGVGVQMLQNGNPVVFNSAISAGTVSAGSSSIVSLSARYIRTLASLSAGTANANATIVVSYN